MPNVYIKQAPRANSWTSFQKDLLVRLRALKKDWPEIAERCSHPVSSCQSTLSTHRAAMRKAGLTVQKGPGDRKPFTRYVPPAPAPLPPEPVAPPSGRTRHTSTMVSDAELRARIEILGPTGGLLGDPLPGRSALDQRKAGGA